MMMQKSLFIHSLFLLTSQIIVPCHSLMGNFKLPRMPWQNGPETTETLPDPNLNSLALQPGDTVAVIGASGNVGKLVALRLSDTYNVNGIVRDAASVESFFKGREDRIQLFEANLLDEMTKSSSGVSESLLGSLENANAIVICTGTTAFPTKAWTKSGEEDVAGDVIQALLDNSFSVKESILSLDEKGLNTPNNVDTKSNEFIIRLWNDVCKVGQKRVIMLSSIGVQRRDSMPFPILNACGVLSAKAAGEKAIQNAAEENGYSYTIIRPGQLFGGPYDNNYYPPLSFVGSMSVLANTLFGRRLFAANILVGRRLFAANVGDPRVVLCCSGGLCVELTSGHKPNRPDEALSYSILTIEDCNDTRSQQHHEHVGSLHCYP